MIYEHCVLCSRRVEWVVLGINMSLLLIKLVFTFMSGSRALFADAIESLANLIITVIVLLSLRIADKEFNERFPYGYGKIEFLTSGIINLLLLFGAVYFMLISIKEMFLLGPEKSPGLIAIIAAVISIAGNWVAFRYGRCVGEKVGSEVILANAWINYADIFTSVAVVVAVVGSNLGVVKLDHVMSVLIALVIIRTTGKGIEKAIKGLLDSSLRFEENRVKNLIKNINGIKQIHNVRTRQTGRKIHVNLDVVIPKTCKIKEGLKIVESIKTVLRKEMKNIADVSVQLIPAGG